MGVLRSIEHRIESLVEGVFGRAFRSHVQPVELARKLAKEMDEHKTVSVSRVYVPNEYVVYLAPQDREQFAQLRGRARRRARRLPLRARTARGLRAALPAPGADRGGRRPRVGEFGIATRSVQPPARPARPRRSPHPHPQPPPGPQETRALRARPEPEPPPPPRPRPPPAPEPDAAAGPRHSGRGTRIDIVRRERRPRAVAECDIMLDDQNVVPPPRGDPGRGRSPGTSSTSARRTASR